LPPVNFNGSGKQDVKINQSFVIEKIIPSMAASVYKWFCLFVLTGCLALLSWTPARRADLRAAHPYYISVVEINHNAKDKTLEISCKIFTNDFESTLEKNYKTKVDLTSPKDKAAMDKMVSDYVSKRLSLKADGRPVSYSYIGYEKQDEAIYSYFEVDNIPTVKKLDVTNSLLHDFSDQQINIVHCIVGGKRQSTKLDYPNTSASFSW
jgi:hypothetical protein